MKYLNLIRIISLFGFMLLFNSCETTINDATLPYKEQLVIRSILEEGKPLLKLSVEKTLPPIEEYDKSKALISDATVSIFQEENQHKFTFNGSYYENTQFIPKAGTNLKLSVEWKNKEAISETRIPNKPIFDSIYWEKTHSNQWDGPLYTFFTYINPEKNTHYIGSFIDNGGYKMNFTDSLASWNKAYYNGKVKVIFGNFFNYGFNEKIFIDGIYRDFSFVITAYDEPFLNYFNTRYNSNSSSSIFGMDGANIHWNIVGDGIGLFLGTNVYQKKIK